MSNEKQAGLTAKQRAKDTVIKFMLSYGEDTFIPNKYNQMLYQSECGITKLNLTSFFEDLAEQIYEESNEQTARLIKERNELKQQLDIEQHQNELLCQTLEQYKSEIVVTEFDNKELKAKLEKAISKWISFEDRYPEDYQEVLIYALTKEGMQVLTAKYCDDFDFNFLIHNYNNKMGPIKNIQIIKWMPYQKP